MMKSAVSLSQRLAGRACLVDSPLSRDVSAQCEDWSALKRFQRNFTNQGRQGSAHRLDNFGRFGQKTLRQRYGYGFARGTRRRGQRGLRTVQFRLITVHGQKKDPFASFIDHLQFERRLSANTVSAYRADLCVSRISRSAWIQNATKLAPARGKTICCRSAARRPVRADRSHGSSRLLDRAIDFF